MKRYKTGGYGAMVEDEAGKWVAYEEAAAIAAPPVHDCETWRLEGLGCARCNTRVPDTPQGCDHKALLQQTAAALWDLQHEPDCWCAYSGGSGPTGHTEACAQARVVNKRLKAAGVQHWEPPR